MRRTDGFRQQHALLGEHANRIASMLPGLRGHEAWMREALTLFASALTSHSAQEDDRLYPLLLKHHDHRLRAQARELRIEFGVIYAAVEVFIAVWTREGALEAEPDRFITEVTGVVQTLRERIMRENDVLYTTIDAL